MTTKPRRVTVTLSEDVAGAVDELAAKRECARSALVENALRWYLRVQDLAWDEASPEEIEAIERGRAEIGRGEFVTFEEIKRDLEADLLEQRTMRSDKASTEGSRQIDRALDELALDPAGRRPAVEAPSHRIPSIPPHSVLRVGDYRTLFDLERDQRHVEAHDMVRRHLQSLSTTLIVAPRSERRRRARGPSAVAEGKGFRRQAQPIAPKAGKVSSSQ